MRMLASLSLWTMRVRSQRQLSRLRVESGKLKQNERGLRRSWCCVRMLLLLVPLDDPRTRQLRRSRVAT